MIVKAFCSLLLTLSLVGVASAQPWLDAGDWRLRQHLQLLQDGGHIDVSFTTWPIMWADVDLALQQVDLSRLNSAERYAWRELQFEKKQQAKAGFKRKIGLHLQSQEQAITHFAKDEYSKAALTKQLSWDGRDWAFALQAQLEREPDGEYTTHFDGSFLAYATQNWVLGAGAIERWWGPSDAYSLILSNHARPVPAVFVRRKASTPFESVWLNWLGAWDFVTFVGQLEESRVVPEAKLTGMRFTFRPFAGLEVGLSRAMQWGGKGRDDGPDAFFKSLTSQDENTKDGAGNQLGGFDARYGFQVGEDVNAAFYFQAIGEDEAGFMPSKYSAQFGTDWLWSAPNRVDSWRLNLEWLDSTAGVLGAEHPNTAYEHSTYRSGYRYRGLPLGASVDNDSRAVSGAISWLMPGRKALHLRLDRWALNRVGGGERHSLTSTRLNLLRGQLGFEFVWRDILWNAGFSVYSSEVDRLIEKGERVAIGLGLIYRY